MKPHSRAKFLCVALLLATLPAFAGESKIDTKLAAEAPLFERAKMRGRLRDDVSLDVVKQTPGDGYQSRVVEWWPKKGVDLIEAPKTEPRTWTISQKPPKPRMDVKWWPKALREKKQFKAHLLGFRGIGAGQNPWDADVTKPLTPAVVLRLPDGRKRCFGRGSFTDADERYITDLYEKQMKVLRDNTFEEGFERVEASHNRNEELSDNPLYTPGTTHISSKHFTATLGSEPPDKGVRSKWLMADDKERAALNRKLIMRGWEDWWSYLEHGGHLMFFSEKLGPKYKYRFLVGLTKKDGKNVGGGFGGGYGACSGGDGNWWGLYHEWGHGIPTGNSIQLGGGEALADSGQLIGDPTESIHKCYFQIMKPWKNLFHGWYPAAYTWNILGDDPNWGYVFPYAITRMMSDAESTPMHVIARVGEKRGIFKNGIRGLGDLMGQVGARMAEFDNELQSALRRSFAMPTRVRLLEIDRKENRYRSDPASAPEAFGVNIVRLVPDANAKELTVDFEGHYDPKTYSDWRACIVAVDKNGVCRYSPLWNKGKMSMKTHPGDMRYWLTVTAAPTALSPTTGSKGLRYKKAHVVYQGGFGYRYPYDVVLKGCRAGSPHSTPLDDETLGQGGLKAGRRYGMGMNVASIPVTDPDQRERVEAVLKAKGGENAQWHLDNMKGKRHPNGGGWVADTATVDATAYVGPNAMVLDEAKVLDNAVIEDYVIVYGDAVFKDNARAYGKLPVKKGVFSKNARAYRRTDPVSDLKKPKTLGYDIDAPQRRYALLTTAPPIQANYEMFHPEATLLEDHFNERSGSIFGAHIGDRIFFDGVLIGNPGFTYDGVETGAVTFNGKDQWAEMPGELADLEVITIDVRFKVESAKQQQTVWMFGNDATSQVSLSVAGGELVLLGRGDGKRADCSGGKVVADQWTTVRAELDGTTMKLFQDGKLILAEKTDFRASDAFTPGKVRKATLGGGFGGANPMAGAVDYLRLFTEVLDDFETVEIPFINPRRLCPRTLARFDAKFPNSAATQLHFREKVAPNHPLAVYYRKYAKGLNSRLEDLAKMNGDRIQTLEDQIDALATRRQETYTESRLAKKNDKAYQERFKESGQKLEALRKKRVAALWLHQGYKESHDKREAMNATLRQRRKEVTAELKKTPAYPTLLEKIKTMREKVNLMRRQKDKGWKKENKKLQELDRQRWQMVAAKMGAEADQLGREINAYGHTVEAQKALAKDTPEYIEANKQYQELEAKLRYIPDPKFAQERKKIDKTLKETKDELEILKKVAAVEANPNEAYIVAHSRNWGNKLNGMPRVVLEGMLPKPFDHAPHLEAARKLQSLPWPTTVDWDGRAEYEKNKKVIAQPIMQHYLKRMKPWMYK